MKLNYPLQYCQVLSTWSGVWVTGFRTQFCVKSYSPGLSVGQYLDGPGCSFTFSPSMRGQSPLLH